MEWEPFIRLIAAAGFAGAIGLDRELRAKPAGLRTNIVVGVAAGAFAYAGLNSFPAGDPSRVASQIVSGIGFLGGGAIFAAGGRPHGLTTAAALWGSAAAGLAAGVGDYMTGFALVAVTVLALWPLDWVASSLLASRRRTDMRLAVVVRDLAAASTVRALLHEAGVRIDHLDMRPFGDEHVAVELAVHATRPQLAGAIAALRVRDDVLFISEEAVPGEEGAAIER
ncbi:MAG: MgtC/SapB family protein [Nitriliruptorales bacterium]